MADIELNEEGDAFLPNGSRKQQYVRDNIIIRYLPRPIRTIVKTLSTLKLMIVLLASFLILLGLLAMWNSSSSRFTAVRLPPENIALSKELARNLSGTTIPVFALTYAPLVFLDKNDIYYPSDLATHVASTHPTINFTSIPDTPPNLTLDNLDALNSLEGGDVYLSSTIPVTDFPSFMKGTKPDAKTLRTEGAVSAVVIVVEKEDRVVDVFYMYFYSFNDGPSALGHKVGNHLGDWEHNMIRFQNGIPQSVWFSRHEYGAAISYTAVHKIGRRPVAFSAKGSHANYMEAASHDLAASSPDIPAHIVYDYTSAGPLWDPVLSAYFYIYSSPNTSSPTNNNANGTFTPISFPSSPAPPTSHLYFEGRWGDDQFTDEMKGQEEFHGFRKWIGGPKGPLDKWLEREGVCWVSERECIVEDKIV